ncbi:hypothetical protein PYJP_11100 [Pyrofollis japonicus]|uniref:transglutaminase-like domain-containing protein n=1 Tax=Pyrofollis japonicus TaxID=3060460 RepID=UPI00295BFDF1|nr:transglutaminase-like domain-containing protein [Pyrofollis japonicus]BEP17758.1 hypothetical protein PYJP_11100 [Pyrofollis japonicus]
MERVYLVVVVVLVVVAWLSGYMVAQYMGGHEETVPDWCLELKESYGALKEELREINESYKTLLGNYSLLLARLQETERNYSAMLGSYEGLRAKAQELATRLAEALGNLSRLSAKYSEALRKLAEYESLVNALSANYTACVKAKALIESRLIALNNSYQELLRRYEGLSAQYQQLFSNYKELLEEFKTLQANYTELSKEYRRLKERYEALLENYSANADLLTRLVVRTDLWNGYILDEEDFNEFLDSLLAEDTKLARKLSITHEVSGLKTSQRVLRVWSWILSSMGYFPDSYTRVTDPFLYDIHVTHQTWELLNETIAKGGGDCEDLALLAYSVLSATKTSSEKVYLITILIGEDGNKFYGHMAALVVRTLSNGKEYYIVDPAGNYLNGISMAYLVKGVYANGTYWEVPLWAHALSRETKEYLMRWKLATIVYYMDGSQLRTPAYKHFREASQALRDWLGYWAGQLGSIVFDARIRLDTIGFHKIFQNYIDVSSFLEEEQ